jgi:2-succinyl-5-enolpyruvyl-6-hydroxy-3-cyclohexene-1-carboxylate synthase
LKNRYNDTSRCNVSSSNCNDSVDQDLKIQYSTAIIFKPLQQFISHYNGSQVVSSHQSWKSPHSKLILLHCATIRASHHWAHLSCMRNFSSKWLEECSNLRMSTIKSGMMRAWSKYALYVTRKTTKNLYCSLIFTHKKKQNFEKI